MEVTSCEIIGGLSALRLTFNVTQDVAGNRSVVRLNRVEMRTLVSIAPITCCLAGDVYVNGVHAGVMNLTNTTACVVDLSQEYSGGSEGDVLFSGFEVWDVPVEHGQDGAGEITAQAGVAVYSNLQKLDYSISGRVTTALPRIPRVSALTAAGVALGQKMTLALSRAAAGFQDTVTWRCGTRNGTLAERTEETALTWTVPLELAAQAPEAIQVPVVLTVTTFYGGAQVGSRDTEVSCTVPESVVPTVTAEVTDRLGYADRFGGYIQGQSQARVVTQAAGAYGSTIRQIRVSCGGLSGTGAETCFALEQSGNVALSVTVTDSRGRTAAWEGNLTVLPYAKPRVSIREACRCDEEGTPQADGAWLKLVFDGAVTALEGNSAAYRCLCTIHGGGDTRQVELTDYQNQQTVTGGVVLLTAGADTSYDCRITVQDEFCTVESEAALVSVAFALLDFCRGTKAVGIGMRAKNPGKLSIGLDADMGEHRIGNLPEPAEDTDAATKAYVDGCILRLAQRLGLEA